MSIRRVHFLTPPTADLAVHRADRLGPHFEQTCPREHTELREQTDEREQTGCPFDCCVGRARPGALLAPPVIHRMGTRGFYLLALAPACALIWVIIVNWPRAQ